MITSELIRRCWRLHNPVIRRGSMHPSLRRYWLRISTSVCLMSSPRLHWGQNCCPLPHLVSATCCSSWLARGEATYSALMTSASFWVASLTVGIRLLGSWSRLCSLKLLTFLKMANRCYTECSQIIEKKSVYSKKSGFYDTRKSHFYRFWFHAADGYDCFDSTFTYRSRSWNQSKTNQTTNILVQCTRGLQIVIGLKVIAQLITY